MEDFLNNSFERLEQMIDERFQDVLYNGCFGDDEDPYDYITFRLEVVAR